jgi:hypothetical protein
MPDPVKNPHAEIKRLRKAVKRRRGYVENLRATARQHEASDLVVDQAFGRRLNELADEELRQARADETQAAALEAARRDPQRSAPVYSSAESQQRAENAMRAMAGRFAIDRVAALASRHGVQEPSAGSMREALDAIERVLGILHEDGVPMTGARIDNAERISGTVVA